MALSFSAESWIWYTFAVGMIMARLISRTLLFRSPKGLQYDDWIMGLFVTACYTVLIVTSNMQARSQTNLLPPNFDISTLQPQEISSREYGSKIVIVVEQMQLVIIWSCKACLLIMYHRLTRMALATENTAIKLLALYVFLGFFVTEILYFTTWCRPFSSYWALPSTNSQCTALTNHRIVKAVFTLSSELVLLSIALTIFIRSLLPLKRKLILCGIFSLGIFVVAAGILNSYYSFKHPYRPTWVYWYIRESSTAILVANMPFTWTLLRKIFHLGAFDEEHPPAVTYHSSRTAGGRRTARAPSKRANGKRAEAEGNARPGGGRERMSLMDSMFTHTRSRLSSQLSTQTSQPSTQTSQNLDNQHIYSRDFATLPSLNEGHVSLPQYPPSCVVVLPSSSSSSSPPRPPRMVPDGTGGFHAPFSNASLRGTNYSISPPPPPLAKFPTRRSMSPLPSQRPSSVTSGGARSSTRAVGGGRSARDRRARGEMRRKSETGNNNNNSNNDVDNDEK